MRDDVAGPDGSALSEGLGRLRDRLIAYSDIRQRDPRESRDALHELLTDELLRIEQERARSKQAMDVLRQIAGMQRRTREQRLASSCVAFLDSLDERPNVGGEARLAAHQPSQTTTATPQGVASTDQLGGRVRSEKD